MSSVLVVAPVVVAAWPIMAAAIAGAAATLGFAVGTMATEFSELDDRTRRKAVPDSGNRAEIEVEDSEILAGSAGTGEEMVIERDGIRAVFSRDARGALKLCMEGKKLSKAELRRLGEQLIGRVTQQYAYDRVVSELNERQMEIVDQRVSEDQSITIRVRNS